MASIAITVTPSSRRLTIVPVAGAAVGSGNMTAASPIVVTVASHGLATGDYVSFSGITQANWTALNGNSYQITKTSANAFSIVVDGSGFGAYTDAAGLIYQDYNTYKYFPAGIRWSGGEFKAQANDELIIRDKTSTGAVVIDMVETGNGKEIKIGGNSNRAYPFIMMAEQRISQADKTLIILEFD